MTEYYRDTIERNDIPSEIITLKEYTQKTGIVIDTNYIEKNNCYGNAQYLSSSVQFRGELTYVEGVITNGKTLIHHAWCYSQLLDCYVEVTLDNVEGYDYYISDELKDKDLDEFVDSLLNDDDEYVPRFIHYNEPVIC